MLNILIVDDEPVHIQGLLRHVPWGSLGFAEPQVAESGEEALQILSASDIDVLLTDVSMPEMTGIDLLAKCKADYSHLHQMQTIIISGYNDFEFVRDAIHVAPRLTSSSQSGSTRSSASWRWRGIRSPRSSRSRRIPTV